MDYKIIDIEGIGDVYAQKLIAAREVCCPEGT